MSIVEIIQFIFVESNFQHVDFSQFWFIYLLHYRIVGWFTPLPLCFSFSFCSSVYKQKKRSRKKRIDFESEWRKTNSLYVQNFSCSPMCVRVASQVRTFSHFLCTQVFLFDFLLIYREAIFHRSPRGNVHTTRNLFSENVLHIFIKVRSSTKRPNRINTFWLFRWDYFGLFAHLLHLFHLELLFTACFNVCPTSSPCKYFRRGTVKINIIDRNASTHVAYALKTRFKTRIKLALDAISWGKKIQRQFIENGRKRAKKLRVKNWKIFQWTGRFLWDKLVG